MPRFLLKSLAITCITFLLLELCLWVGRPMGYEPVVRVESTQKIHGCKKEILYQRNQWGLRTRSMDTLKKPSQNTLRILCLGASTTDCATQNIEDTWVGILENLLQKELAPQNQTVQVAAYARGGSKIMGIIPWVKERLAQYQPDIVLTLCGINELSTIDYYHKNASQALWEERLNQRETLHPKIPIPLAPLIQYSQTARYMNTIAENKKLQKILQQARGYNFDVLHLQAFRKAYASYPYYNVVEKKPIARIGKRRQAFRFFMDYYLREIKKTGALPIVLSQPILHKKGMSSAEKKAVWFPINTGAINNQGRPILARLHSGEFREEMTRFNHVQREVAQEHSAPFIDLEKKIPPTLEYFFDDCHFTDLGNQKVAQTILPILKQYLDQKAESLKRGADL